MLETSQIALQRFLPRTGLLAMILIPSGLEESVGTSEARYSVEGSYVVIGASTFVKD